MAGFIKILPLFMMVMPGMISRIKFPGMLIVRLIYCHMFVCTFRAACLTFSK